MLQRERFVKCLKFEKTDRIPLMEMGVWPETLERWHHEGLPWWVGNLFQLENYLGLDKSYNCDWVHINDGFFPSPKQAIIEETDTYKVIRDETGFTRKQGKHNASIPQYIRFPVENIKDYERLSLLLAPDDVCRYDELFDSDMENRSERGEIRGFSFTGLYGFPRELMGVENWSIALHEQPELVKKILDDRLEMAVKLYRRVLATGKIDMIQIWEDMAYNHGPLLSPAMIRLYMLDGYKEIVSTFKQSRVPLVLMDCDGYVEPLLSIIEEAGIDGIYPCERAAGSDPVEIRKKHPGIALLGGVDKRAVAQGRSAILEQMRYLQPVIRDGGYIPFIDHFIPPDISYRDFLYYIELRREMLCNPSMKINPDIMISIAQYG
jgi:hypothetical protein